MNADGISDFDKGNKGGEEGREDFSSLLPSDSMNADGKIMYHVLFWINNTPFKIQILKHDLLSLSSGHAMHNTH